jgi:hypothetical protein
MSETSNDKENDDIKNNKIQIDPNVDVKELIKIPFVKDLVVKIDVLKNGIISERKKTSLLNNKIKELEEELKSKSEQIKSLTQEKENYEKIKEEKEKQNKDNSAESLIKNSNEIRQLNEEIIQLKFEKEALMKKLNTTLLESENSKVEYKSQIKLISEINKSLLEENNKLKSEKEELQKQIYSSSSASVREKEHFEALLKEYKIAKEEAIHQLEACLEKCGKLVVENKTYKDSIYFHETEEGKMAQKLAEYKNLLIKANLRNQIYHVKKVGLVSNVEIDILFGKEKGGNYVMRIDEKGKTEMINIQDVESVNRVDEKKNKVEICYMYKAKKHCINIIVDALVIDQFVEAYKNFYSESMKNQNKINF